MNGLGRKKILTNLRSQLELERSSFISQYRDLSDYILPRRARFTVTDVNKGDRRNTKINDATATLAMRTLRSGMLSGVTSPARPWFRLTTPDPSLAEFGRVKEWLFQVQNIMSNSFLKSNLYNTLPLVYGDMGTFGTAPFSCEEVFSKSVLHTQSYPVGSYMIAVDEYGKVNTFVRDYQMTVGNLVTKYGKKNGKGEVDWSNISMLVKNQYENGNYNTWIEITLVIMPNDLYDPNGLESKFKKFKSVVFERGFSGTGRMTAYPVDGADDMKLLSEKGYDNFPILCGRWEYNAEDAYGTNCPGMEVLGDVKALQLGEKRTFEAIDKMIKPPMVAPASMRNQSSSLLPGDVTYVSDREGGQGFRPAFEMNFQIDKMEGKQEQTRRRIQRGCFEDLFLMIANDDRNGITAEEIRAKKEERLLALGPVLEQLNQDVLDPVIDLSFDFHRRQGKLPPPPPELSGVDLKVEYISVLAQAQKLITIGSVERFTGFASNLIAVRPEVQDKVDFDQLIDVYADITSVVPSIVRTDEKTAEIRAQRQQAVQQQQQAEQAVQQSQAVKNLSQSDTEGQNALTELINKAKAGG